MSNGHALIRAIIDCGARAEFRGLLPDLFTEEERPLYNYVDNYLRRHGTLPALSAVNENGFSLVPADRPVSDYLESVRNRAMFNTIAAQYPALNQAMKTKDMAAAVKVLRDAVYSLGRIESREQAITLHEVLTSVMEDYEEVKANPVRRGVTLGNPVLDAATGGAEPSDIVTTAARPGMGKSQLLAHSSLRAWRSGLSVVFLSMEMTEKQIGRRFLGMHAGVNHDHIRRGEMSYWAEEQVYGAVHNTQTGAPFHFIGGNMSKSVATIEKAAMEFAPDVIYVDASYLLDPEHGNSRYGRHEQLEQVEREIKALAMALKRPIFKSVQLNREAEQTKAEARRNRGDEAPKGAKLGLRHLAGSDAIGKNSSIIIGIEEGDAPFERTRRRLTVLKGREGGLGTTCQINFLFDPPNFDVVPEVEEGTALPAGVDPGFLI
ncbi:hypothetical protein [Azospirillum argentinense]|uniref:DnaB-like helicase C-terminal domain-containing protein n=1 Tax=Azospirillum argentinense TaxID=2970906 RepID=UPI0032DEE229